MKGELCIFDIQIMMRKSISTISRQNTILILGRVRFEFSLCTRTVYLCGKILKKNHLGSIDHLKFNGKSLTLILIMNILNFTSVSLFPKKYQPLDQQRQLTPISRRKTFSLK